MPLIRLTAIAALTSACLTSAPAHAVGIGQVLGLPFELGSPQSAVEKAGFKCYPTREHPQYKAFISWNSSFGNLMRSEWDSKYTAVCEKSVTIPGIAQAQQASVYLSAISGDATEISSTFPSSRAGFMAIRKRIESFGEPPGNFQGSCRKKRYAACFISLVFSRSGLSQTVSGNDQSRMSSRQRPGFLSRAA